MAKSEDHIRQDLVKLTQGTPYKDQYIGITDGPDERLAQHGVDPEKESIIVSELR